MENSRPVVLTFDPQKGDFIYEDLDEEIRLLLGILYQDPQDPSNPWWPDWEGWSMELVRRGQKTLHSVILGYIARLQDSIPMETELEGVVLRPLGRGRSGCSLYSLEIKFAGRLSSLQHLLKYGPVTHLTHERSSADWVPAFLPQEYLSRAVAYIEAPEGMDPCAGVFFTLPGSESSEHPFVNLETLLMGAFGQGSIDPTPLYEQLSEPLGCLYKGCRYVRGGRLRLPLLERLDGKRLERIKEMVSEMGGQEVRWTGKLTLKLKRGGAGITISNPLWRYIQLAFRSLPDLRSLAHGDLNPQNILLTINEDGQIEHTRLIDFGKAFSPFQDWATLEWGILQVVLAHLSLVEAEGVLRSLFSPSRLDQAAHVVVADRAGERANISLREVRKMFVQLIGREVGDKVSLWELYGYLFSEGLYALGSRTLSPERKSLALLVASIAYDRLTDMDVLEPYVGLIGESKILPVLTYEGHRYHQREIHKVEISLDGEYVTSWEGMIYGDGYRNAELLPYSGHTWSIKTGSLERLHDYEAMVVRAHPWYAATSTVSWGFIGVVPTPTYDHGSAHGSWLEVALDGKSWARGRTTIEPFPLCHFLGTTLVVVGGIRPNTPTLELWEIQETGSVERRQQEQLAQLPIAIGGDSSRLVFAYENKLEMRGRDLVLDRTWRYESARWGKPTRVALSRRFLAIGTDRGAVLIIDVQRQRARYTPRLEKYFGTLQSINEVPVTALDIHVKARKEVQIAVAHRSEVVFWRFLIHERGKGGEISSL